jgi:hypothetical protein
MDRDLHQVENVFEQILENMYGQEEVFEFGLGFFTS